MKKFLAVFLAAMFVFSGCVVAFAYTPTCDFCGQTFATDEELNAHIAATFPIKADDGHAAHEKACGNKCDKNFDGEISADEMCPESFTTKAAYDAHKAGCTYDDSLSNWDKFVGYIKAGIIGEAAKYLVKVIVDFVKSDTFKTIIGKVVDVVKGIDFGKIISTVKGVIEKLPLDKIKGAIGDLVG